MRWVRYVLGLGLLAVISYFGISGYTAWSLTRTDSEPISSSPENYGLSYEEVSFSSREDGLTLQGWLFPVTQSRRAVIMVHGRNGNRADIDIDMLGIAKGLVAEGYTVLTFDLRGHGQSEGERLSLGLFEQRDVMGAVGYLEERGFATGRIGLLGFSMGAATVILVAADHPEIGAVAADSAYASLRDILNQELPKASGLPDLFNEGTYFMGRLLLGLDVDAVDPEAAVAGIDPSRLLLIHGEDDDVVPVAHAQRLEWAAGGGAAILWLVPNADHVRAYRTAPKAYLARLADFFGRTLGEP